MAVQEVVEQLAECLAQNGEEVDTPANLWMNDLVNAYVSTSRTSPKHLSKCFTLNRVLPQSDCPSPVGAPPLTVTSGAVAVCCRGSCNSERSLCCT